MDNLKIMSRDNLDYIKTKVKDLALMTFHSLFLIKNLKCKKLYQEIPGNSVILVEKCVYIRLMEMILDAMNFEKVDFDSSKLG